MANINAETLSAVLTVETYNKMRAVLTAPGTDPVDVLVKASAGKVSPDAARKAVDEFLAMDVQAYLAQSSAFQAATGDSRGRLALNDEAAQLRAGRLSYNLYNAGHNILGFGLYLLGA